MAAGLVHRDTSGAVGDLEVIARWQRWLRARGLAEATVRLYSYGVFRLLTESGAHRLAAITEDDVARFLEGIGARSATRIQYLRGIRSFFGWAHARGLLTVNPAGGLNVRKPFRSRPVALDEDELRRLLVAAAWRSERRGWTLLLAFSIGARRMELEAIRPEDIEGDTVHLRQCKYGKARRVELNRYAVAALEGLRPWWNGTVLGGVSRTTVTAWAAQAARDAGLAAKVRGRPAHILRASFISHLLREGVPVHVVRDLAGHENLSTTNEYAAVLQGDRRLAVDRLDFGHRPGGESRRSQRRGEER